MKTRATIYATIQKIRKHVIFFRRISMLLLLIVFASAPAVVAQQRTGTENNGGTVISAKTGVSVLATDIFHDFSDIVQFNNLAGPHAGIGVSHFFTFALETGAGFSWSAPKGNADSFDLSILGNQFALDENLNGAVNYNIRLYGPELFARYHFGPNLHQPGSFNFFIQAGAGIMFYELELAFSDRELNDLIFGNRFQSDKSSNLVYTLGGGFSYGISEMVRLNIAASLNWMHFDIPDVIQHFNLTGNQESVPGTYSAFSAGISFKLTQQKRSTNNPAFPFSP